MHICGKATRSRWSGHRKNRPTGPTMGDVAAPSFPLLALSAISLIDALLTSSRSRSAAPAALPGKVGRGGIPPTPAPCPPGPVPPAAEGGRCKPVP